MARFRFRLRLRERAGLGKPQVAGFDRAARVPHGPGWFESSWELVRGLDVREGLPGDARLHEWLEACLRGAAAPSALAEHPAPARARPGLAAPHGAPVETLQPGDLDLVAAAEMARLDRFGRFGIDGLELV